MESDSLVERRENSLAGDAIVFVRYCGQGCGTARGEFWYQRIVSHGVSYSTMIYPCVFIRLNKAVNVEVAIDLDTKEVVNVTSYPVRIPPTISPPPT